MHAYMAAHEEFVAWLDGLPRTPAADDVAVRLFTLAERAAERGMTSTHWAFVVDGLVAHANRRYPGDPLLASYLARGFDLASQWSGKK